MATRRGAKLPPNTSLLDFSTPAKILEKLGSDAAVRREYSRQRSIIRKRVERMAAQGETSSQFYKTFGDLATALPTAKGLSTQEMLMRMTASARAIGGGYQSTLTQVKAARQETASRLADQARQVGDVETANALERGLTPSQMEKMGKLWGILRATMGKRFSRAIGSGDINLMIAETVIEGKRSVLSMAATLINDLGGGTAELEGAMERYTQTGKERVAWTRSHRKGAGSSSGKKGKK